jgi:hypothetical protein
VNGSSAALARPNRQYDAGLDVEDSPREAHQALSCIRPKWRKAEVAKHYCLSRGSLALTHFAASYVFLASSLVPGVRGVPGPRSLYSFSLSASHD